MYLPEKITKVLISIGYEKSDNIADFWFKDRVKVEKELIKHFTDNEIQALNNQIRWKSKAGIECQKTVRSHIEEISNVPILDAIAKNQGKPFSNLAELKVIDFSSLTFEFEGKTIPVNDFQDMYGYIQISPMTNLAGIDLCGISIKQCTLVNVCLGYANFEGARLEHVIFKNAPLNDTNFKRAFLNRIYFQKSYMSNANVEGAYVNLVELNNESTNSGYKYKKVSYLYLLKCLFLVIFKSSTFSEDRTNKKHTEFLYNDTKKLTSPDNLPFKNYLDWYQYIFIKFRKFKELTKSEKVLFSLSLIFTKSWTSYGVLASLAMLTNMIFALIYHLNQECLSGLDESFFTAFYYSIVTFTTLGYGEIYPIDAMMRFVVMLEVILGYITLGSFVFLIGHKVNDRF